MTDSTRLTAQQLAVLEAKGDCSIHAVAGSGKTTTLIEFARTRPRGTRILYLAFNKSVRDEARQRFDAEGLGHVDVETAHSLAFRYIMRGSRLELAPRGYKTHEIATRLGLQSGGEKHAEFVLANQISRLLACFCNSSAARVSDLDDAPLWQDPQARDFAARHRDALFGLTRKFLLEMNSGAWPVTHDFYLKKFQLAKPVLPYDVILFDEGQDASPAMLDVLLHQKAAKVVVGDPHQQIYSWRFAVNALEAVPFPVYPLTGSFRFGPGIAALAEGILAWKEHLGAFKPVRVEGLRAAGQPGPVKATIGRSNLALLLRAIDFVSDRKKRSRLYFEGQFNSYTFADDGASLYDVMNLATGRPDRIRDELIRSLGSVEELRDYIDKTEDHQLDMMLQVVDEYGDRIPALLQQLRERLVDEEHRREADMTFSTVHRAKGMEYDTVHLLNDFVPLDRLKTLMTAPEAEKRSETALKEEVNLLYVAATRARHTLFIPEELIPEGLTSSPEIRRVTMRDHTFQAAAAPPADGKKPPVRSYFKKEPAAPQPSGNAYAPWRAPDEAFLKELVESGIPLREMARRMGRTRGAIASRIKKLGLEGGE